MNELSSHRPTRWFERAVTIALLPVVVLLSSGCKKTTADTVKATRPPPTVIVASAAQRDVPVEVSAPVELRPLEQVDVGSKILGYLDVVLVDRGDRVRKGQPIALVRPSDLPDQLAAARSSYAQVQSSTLLARTNYERALKLEPAGVISQQELEQSKTAVAATNAAEAASKAQLEALAVRLGETRITSPIEGVVAMRKLDPGALVGTMAGAAIATIMRVDRLRAFVTVVERYATSVVAGMPARVTLDAAPGEEFSGTVVRVSPAVDPNTRTLEAEVQLDNRDGRLRPGMYGRGYIRLNTHPGATVVPINAVTFGGTKPRVYVATGDTVHLKEVTTGAELEDGAFIEIVDGVRPDDRVVVAGADGLVDGAKVRVSQGKPNGPGRGSAVKPASSGAPASSTRP
jgi:RND family efflux transporter MFP subunit